MFKRLLFLLILAPIAIVLVWLAVTNRQTVDVMIPPDVAGQPLFTFQIPLYMLFFGTLLAGIVIGSFTTWCKQGKHRKAARERKVQATKWEFEAQKEKERASDLAQKVATVGDQAASRGLPAPNKAA